MPRPICFMIMPYRTKETQAAPPAPAKVNFDALWEKALRPAVEEMGYQPVRADQDLGALIITEMLQRLYWSDLVIADLTVPNGNVYYEVGVRPAARNAGCVLVSADWSKALFDLDQMRQVRYPLPEQEVTDATAELIREKLTQAVPALAAGAAPLFQALPGYPTAVDPRHADVIKDFFQQLSNFQAEVRAVREAPQGKKKGRALALRDHYATQRPIIPAVALEIMYLVRDFVGREETLAWISALPADIAKLPLVREQRCLALAKVGSPVDAIGALQELIKTDGATSEREGLLGGRYKQLYREATGATDKAKFLDKAIEHYERGMKLDLNDYFPSCNLPRLYQVRGKRGDQEQAQAAAEVARLACERARELKIDDEWVRPTLLGMAFFAGDVPLVEELAEEVAAEGAVEWKLATTFEDLKLSTGQTKDAETRASLEAVVERLNALLVGSSDAGGKPNA